ncbi:MULTISPECIES: hypothetical protein [Brevibacillus]|uniref:hypothetical protein n=1 Tax=Brevibacillus TaxID=55080 RepID=UPI00175B77B8|nr:MULTISPECIES: hypothetical protein [Brevibacillus]MDR9507579.1 hypothetical protein [Brevibacillus agri]WNF05533.1 hypothetical protein RFB14_24925 [Brevibacillus borstelensis]HAJ4019655.1 hypothetical protein [Escherichia coli]
MKGKITDQESWDHGKAFGMVLALRKYLEQYFEFVKSDYLEKLTRIHDLDLVEKMNDSIFSVNRSREDFELVLNAVNNCYKEQVKRNEKQLNTE